MANEFMSSPTSNYKAHCKEMKNLSVTDIIHAADYIKALSQFIDGDNEILDDMDEVLEPLNKVTEKLRTDKYCSQCRSILYKSELPQYDHVCPDCGENF